MSGMREKGAERAEIAGVVKKKDGAFPPVQTVDGILQRFKDEPDLDGTEDRTAGGRPRDVAAEQLQSIRKILLRDVGKHVVSATHVKRILRQLRHVPDRTIQRCFQRLGYSYLRRRGSCCNLVLSMRHTFVRFALVRPSSRPFVRPRARPPARSRARAAAPLARSLARSPARSRARPPARPLARY